MNTKPLYFTLLVTAKDKNQLKNLIDYLFEREVFEYRYFHTEKEDHFVYELEIDLIWAENLKDIAEILRKSEYSI